MIDNNSSAQKIFASFIKNVKQVPELKILFLEVLALDALHRKDELDILLFHPLLTIHTEELEPIFEYLLDDYFARHVKEYLEINTLN